MLLLPNVPVTRESREFTAPIRLYYYLAAKKPVIASDLPSIRDMVDEEIISFFEPGNAKALAKSIINLESNSQKWQNKIAKGFTMAKRLTWEFRAKSIMSLIEKDV